MKGKVMTVLGPIDSDDLGVTMSHEHIFIDLSHRVREPCDASLKSYVYEPVRMDNLNWIKRHFTNNSDNMLLNDIKEATEEVMDVKRFGGNSIVDVTNHGIGRDPIAIRKVAIETGMNVIMGSGYYVGISHPPEMSEKTEEDIAKEIIKDVKEGVGDTGIKSGVIGEIGVENFREDPNEEKVLRGAVIAQKETGAPLYIHPPFTRECERIIEILEEEGADLQRVILCHSDFYIDESMEYTFMIADAGIYIEYDTWGFEGDWYEMGLWEPSDTQRAVGTKKLIDKGYQDKILFSTDICMKMMSMKYGGPGRAHILRDCLPLLRKYGVTDQELETILVDNPKKVLQFV